MIEAIRFAKMNRSVFIVHIYGDDVASNEMTETWNDENIRQWVTSNNCVAIKLLADSQPGRQFSQIYPVMCVPSVFFINGSNGIPLEVCGGFLSPAELVDKFRHALQLHDAQQTSADNLSASQTQTSSIETTSSDRSALVDRTVSNEAVHQSNEESLAQVCPNITTDSLADTSHAVGVSRQTDDESMTSVDDALPECSSDDPEERRKLEEKKERAAALLAERRDTKEAEEKEKAKQEEVERRKLGQEMSKFKNWKDDMQKKEIETSLRKDKEEAKRAREKVREDIERDRQERAARFQKEKNDEKAVTRAKADVKSQAETELQARRDATRRESARIQFRLPDGSSVTQSFSSSESLSTARDFILQRLSVGSVTLVCTFPKRTFSEADMTASFLDLDLVPSAALIVLVTSHGQVARGGGDEGVGGFVKYILDAMLAVWMFFIGFFSRTTNQTTSHAQQSAQSDSAASGAAVSQRTVARDEGLPSSRDIRHRQQTASGVKKRKEETGNIHRLHDDDNDSDDDENATWNGNSTQQM